MTTWISVKNTTKPPKNRPLIAHCPQWSDSSYQICTWDGKSFSYDEDPNGSFEEYVIAWSLFMEAD